MKILTSINLPWGHARSHKNVGPIGLAVLTFIGYKHTDKQAKFMYRYGHRADKNQGYEF